MTIPANDGSSVSLNEFLYCVYILKCADNTHYVGYSTNLSDRFKRHSKGEVPYTSTRLPVQIEMYSVFETREMALKFEKYLKSGSGRAFAGRHFYRS